MHTIQDLPFFISICLLLVWVWSVSTICVCVCVSFEPGISLGDNPGSLCRCIFLFSPLLAFFYRLKCDLWETWLEGCPHSLTFTTRGTLFAGVTMERQMSLLKHSFPWPCCHAVKAAGRLQSFWGEERERWLGLWVRTCSPHSSCPGTKEWPCSEIWPRSCELCHQYWAEKDWTCEKCLGVDIVWSL